MIASRKLLCNRELSSELCDDPVGWDGGGGREAQEGGKICILMADSHCTAESNNNVPPIFKQVIKKKRHWVGACTPEKDLKGKEGPRGHALALESKPPSGHPSPAWHTVRGRKPPTAPTHTPTHTPLPCPAPAVIPTRSDTGAEEAQPLLSRNAHYLPAIRVEREPCTGGRCLIVLPSMMG